MREHHIFFTGCSTIACYLVFFPCSCSLFINCVSNILPINCIWRPMPIWTLYVFLIFCITFFYLLTYLCHKSCKYKLYIYVYMLCWKGFNLILFKDINIKIFSTQVNNCTWQPTCIGLLKTGCSQVKFLI